MNSDDSLIGKSILNYRLTEVLGEGGMATVYKGVNEILGQEVAVKVLDPLLARNTELRDRFIQEARIQVALRHPGIVSVLNAHVEESLCCIIQELIDGKSLDSVLAVAPQVPN